MNEAITVDLVRDYLNELGYFRDKSLVIEREVTQNPQIDKLLKNASKVGNKEGHPDFIITNSGGRGGGGG